MKELIIDFLNFANAPQKLICFTIFAIVLIIRHETRMDRLRIALYLSSCKLMWEFSICYRKTLVQSV